MHPIQRAVLAAALACAASGQKPPSPTTFEVSTVKPTGANPLSFNIEPGPDVLTMRGVTLRQTIQWAYALHEYQMSGGPKWVDTEGFEIIGKTDDSLRALGFTDRIERYRVMLRALLADRFQLSMRREMKDVPAFTLSVAKSGFTLKPIEPGGPQRSYGRPGELAVLGGTVAEFAALLATKFQLPVTNRTAIEGLYNLRVQFAPENTPDSPYPSIFTALQEQCGLKLERSTAPAETFVIERVERPTGN
jgi:uncharacterized protein (TIGR03435 family)